MAHCQCRAAHDDCIGDLERLCTYSRYEQGRPKSGPALFARFNQARPSGLRTDETISGVV